MGGDTSRVAPCHAPVIRIAEPSLGDVVLHHSVIKVDVRSRRDESNGKTITRPGSFVLDRKDLRSVVLVVRCGMRTRCEQHAQQGRCAHLLVLLHTHHISVRLLLHCKNRLLPPARQVLHPGGATRWRGLGPLIGRRNCSLGQSTCKCGYTH